MKTGIPAPVKTSGTIATIKAVEQSDSEQLQVFIDDDTENETLDKLDASNNANDEVLCEFSAAEVRSSNKMGKKSSDSISEVYKERLAQYKKNLTK